MIEVEIERMTITEARRYHQISVVEITPELEGTRCDGCGREFSTGEVVWWGDCDDWYCGEECFRAARRDELLND